jgi:8-oxo-dGTP pyrophosphatase MutT (NUDIX family)
MRPALLKQQTSSGGIIFRTLGSRAEVVLVSVKGGNEWCLPKGIIDKGETPEVTAVREVKEETGLLGRIVAKLGKISYWYYIKRENTKCRKTVHFYLMEYVSGSTAEHDSEVDNAEWLPLETAMKKISFKGDRSILEKAKAKLEDLYSVE